jgi:hypothetical protein
MSNIFNSKSRFAVLSEDKSTNKNERSRNEKQIDRPKYDDRPKYNSNMFSKKISDKALERERENEREAKEIIIAKALDIENFPELVSVEKKVTPVQSYNFLEKTKPKQILVIKNTKEETIPYGWVKLNRDLTTNKIVFNYNANYEAAEKIKKNKKDEEEEIYEENKEKFYSYKVINALNDLHLKRTQEYIDNWGYNEYEKVFLDTNYDSEYFDKLDAKYEEEIEKMREQEIETENNDL